MKRFLLLLLAFVVSVQMSLAVVHLCDNTMSVAALSYVFEHSDASDVHQKTQHSTGHNADPLSDAGHRSVHDCNSFHGLMSQDGNTVGAATAVNFISTSHLLPVSGAFSTRHERPQWRPA